MEHQGNGERHRESQQGRPGPEAPGGGDDPRPPDKGRKLEDRKSDPGGKKKNAALYRNVAVAGVVILAIVAFSFFSDDSRGYAVTDTSTALEQLDKGNVSEVRIEDREQQLRLTLKEPVAPTGDADPTDKLIAQYPARATDEIFDRVVKADPTTFDTKVTHEGFLVQMVQFLLPMLLLFGLIFFFMSRMQGGAGGIFGVGKSRAVEVTKDMPRTTFADVAGEDEAVEELNEIKDFLQNPARYERLGARIPRGVLLYGPPGTGKTLLARAVAGEAGVPFYSISGSDFVEMFVGVGASRVRDLFEKAKQNSPCIIFVDEIDAVGRQRGTGMGGGHDEREQTLNQLLVEMDGFDDRQTVILIAATNRPDVLDPALLRPGRFDRQVPVVNPDLRGREAILAVHAEGKPLAPTVDLRHLAKRTIGMSGADLANVLNEGALLAARLRRDAITDDILDEATDRVVGGPRRKHRVISEHEKKVTAYHESGHALAAWAMEDLEPVHKVTILARGRTGGHALVVPEDDKSLMTRADMIARIVMAMGGRAAEEYVFGEPTSGASSDIEQATKIARAMVMEYGMSSRLGAVKYGEAEGDPFLGRGGAAVRDHSPEIATVIDEEVRRIIDAAQTEAWEVLHSNRDILDACASELLEKETLRQDELERIFADVVKRPRITTFDDFGGRTPSTREPVKTPGELAKERGEPWPPPITDPFSLPSPLAGGGSDDDGRTGGGTPAGSSAGGDVPSGPQPWDGPGTGAYPGGHHGRDIATPGRPDPVSGVPQYGTPPPPGWSAPGWPPATGQGYRPQPVPQDRDPQTAYPLPPQQEPPHLAPSREEPLAPYRAEPPAPYADPEPRAVYDEQPSSEQWSTPSPVWEADRFGDVPADRESAAPSGPDAPSQAPTTRLPAFGGPEESAFPRAGGGRHRSDDPDPADPGLRPWDSPPPHDGWARPDHHVEDRDDDR